ncbi:MAG: sugar phosphate isomerase/epimerase, partial [Clostridia bacterium]|nr:sugar phosphate isomerase/epimerase [Clostridia bacterium]
ELFDINCRLAKALGSKLLVLHLWSGLDSDKDMPHNMEIYPRLEETSRAYGLLLTVENVVCNHLDPFTHLVSLSEKFPNISFTFDTKMSQFHAQTEKLYQNKEVFRRIKHFHINDYGGEYMDWSNLKTLHIGRGNVDFDKLFAYLKEQGYSGDFTVEATSFDENGVIDFDSLNSAFDKIRKYIG